MNIGELVRRQARSEPEKPAVIFGEQRLSYRELDQRSDALLAGLWSAGMRKGARIATLCDNCARYFEVFVAAAKGGLIVVPVNPRLSPAEVRFTLEDSEAAALFTTRPYDGVIAAARPHCPALRQVYLLDDDAGPASYTTLLAEPAQADAEPAVTADDLILVSYTGGTTSTAKGILITHRNLLLNASNVALYFGLNGSTVCLVAMPQSTGGCNHHIIVPGLYVGATFVVMDARPFEPRAFLETVERHCVTDMQLVPTMIYRLLDYPGLAQHDLSALRTIGYGSAPMSAERLREAIERMGPVFAQVYGQTECSSLATFLSREDHAAALHDGDLAPLASCGRPINAVDVKLVDDDDRDVAVGEMGEIVVRGDTVMQGYWRAPEATAEVLRGGWLHTGDVARADARGYLYIVDRKKDMIISGGLNISAREIEEVIFRHASVLECAVIAVPDKEWGEAVKALVVPRADHTIGEQEIIDLCRRHLGAYKRPRSVEFLADLPKNQMGKILKRELKQQYWHGAGRMVG